MGHEASGDLAAGPCAPCLALPHTDLSFPVSVRAHLGHRRAFPTKPAFAALSPCFSFSLAWIGLTFTTVPLNDCLPPAVPTLPLAVKWLASSPLGVLEPGTEPVSSSGWVGGGGRLVTPRVLQEEHREARLTLRPPSLAAPYAPVQSWQHRPEKLIFESCGYEANVSCPCPPSPARLPASCPPHHHCTPSRGSSDAPSTWWGKGGHPSRCGGREPLGEGAIWLWS